MAFDENKYKALFDQRFGSGSFDSGLQQARDIGQLKVQASVAKQDYTARLKAAQAAAKKAQKASEKKTYNDAIAYWNDPVNKAALQKDGAYRAAENIKNDPNKQAEIKAQGYNVTDYINGMYHAASGGQFKSEREYNQFSGQLNKDTKASNKAADKKSKEQHGGLNVQDYWDQVQKPAQDAQKAKQKAQQQAQKSERTGFLGFLDSTLGRAGNVATETLFGKQFNDSQNQRYQNNALDKLKKNPYDKHATQSLQMTNNVTRPAKNGLEKVSDFVGGTAGTLAPYTVGGAYGLADAALGKVGLNAIKNPLAKDLVRGLGAGAIAGTERGLTKKVASNENLSAKDIAIESALAGGGDALFGMAGRGLSKLFKPKPTPPTQELLGLPAPQLRLNAPQLQLPGPKPVAPSLESLNNTGIKPNGLQNPIPGMPKPMSEVLTKQRLIDQGVNFGQGSKFTPKARPNLAPIDSTIDPLKRSPEYWQKRYEDFAKFVKGNGYTDHNLSEGSIQELWTHFAKHDEPVSIQQVVDLAYPKGFEAPPVPKAETPKPENPLITALKNDPKIIEKIKGFFPPLRPEPKVSRLATLDEMVKELGNLAPPKQAPVELPPLQFRVNKGFNPNLKPNILNRVPKTNESQIPNLKQQLAFPTILRSVKTKKTVNSMTTDELNNVYKQLEQKYSALSKGKGNEQKLEAVQEDMDRVKKFLDLQFFGAKEAPIPKPKAGSTNINPAPKGKNADITAPQAIDEHGYGLTDTQALSSKTVKTLQESKDIMPNQTLTKNIYELVDRLPKEIGNKIKTALDTAKINHVNNLEQRSTDLYNKVVKDLGINKGSKESALVQDYGEKTLAKDYLKKRGIDPSKLSEQELNNINETQLKKVRPNDWEKIVNADKYFRDNYKKMIDEVNTTVKQIYPNNPDKIVPERSDYYHHFNELDGFEGFKNLIQNSSAIDPHLAGISPNTKPNSKWQSFKQMRGNGEYKSDAVGGYLKYLQAASHSTHIDPMIKVLRQSADQIATATEGTKNLNNLKTALEVHADNLAGKTNPIDRLFQDHIIGRKVMGAVNFVNGHIKKNLILGNLGSALGQVGSVPLAIGKAKLYAPQGLMDTLGYTANHLLGGSEKNLSSPISKSPFLKERFSGKYFTRFDNGLLKKPEKMAAWLLETADKSGTYFTWHSMYRKGLAKGVADPIKFADTETRHIIAGRGVGEVPIAQRAKVTQLVAPFSLEVGNQWKVLGKQMSEKDFAGVVTFLAASYGLNEVMNRVKGSEVSYNPAGAVMDGYNKADGSTFDKLKGAGASLLGETVGNIPGGNYIPQILGLKSPTAKKALFGDRSPDRFGTGVGVASTIFKPATDAINQDWNQAAKDSLLFAAPFGGNQAKKTWNGIEALAKGGSYDSKGKLQYPVDSSKKSDLLKSLLLGPTTTANGQGYYDNNRKPLSDKQTIQYQNAPNKQDYYINLLNQRQVSAIRKKIKDTQKDQSLTMPEKQKNILILIQELQKLQK